MFNAVIFEAMVCNQTELLTDLFPYKVASMHLLTQLIMATVTFALFWFCYHDIALLVFTSILALLIFSKVFRISIGRMLLFETDRFLRFLEV